MTVKELKNELAKLSEAFDNYPVILQEDQEDNGFRILRGCDPTALFSRSDGEIWNTEEQNTEEINQLRESPDIEDCIILYP